MLSLVIVDPQTMQNFWNALIPLMIAVGVFLQQYNARKGKERGEEAAKQTTEANAAAQAAATLAASAAMQVATHNDNALKRLDTIVDQGKKVIDQTNGINQAIQDKSDNLQAQVDQLKKNATDKPAT
jgi:hypothetical protein